MEQVEEERWVREGVEAARQRARAPLEHVPTAVVAVATGGGVRRLFTSMGVQIVVTGGQTMNPSTQDLVAAVEATAADEVVLLPNNKNIVPVAEQVDALASEARRGRAHPRRVRGGRRPRGLRPRGLGGVQPDAMAAAASAVVAGEVTQAVRDSSCDAGAISTGDWLGIARDGIKVVGARPGRRGRAACSTRWSPRTTSS